MKNEFKAFYNRSDEELEEIWTYKETLFVFDTNVFLNLYSYSKSTQDDFFSVLNKLKKKIWIPHQVAVEYYRRRISVISNDNKTYTEIDNLDIINSEKLKDLNRLCSKNQNPDLYEEKEQFIAKLNDLISEFKGNIKGHNKKRPYVNSKDEIRENIESVFNKKIGDKPDSQKWLDDLYKTGEERYKNNIPPGYKDSAKDNDEYNTFTAFGLNYKRKFGDLIIWEQIIEYCLKNKDIKYLVLITDDSKEDWWESIKSGGNKLIGARYELREEIYSRTNQAIDYFHMYQTSNFLNDANKYIDTKVQDSSIDETNQIIVHQTVKDFIESNNFEGLQENVNTNPFFDRLKERNFQIKKNRLDILIKEKKGERKQIEKSILSRKEHLKYLFENENSDSIFVNTIKEEVLALTKRLEEIDDELGKLNLEIFGLIISSKTNK